MKLGYAQSQPQQEYAELPTAMLEPVELSTSDADTPGSPFLEKSFRFGSSIDGGAHDRWAGGRSGSGSGGGWGHR